MWSDILPSHTWVTVGSHDLFIDDIMKFKNHAVADGASIHVEVRVNGTHSWNIIADSGMVKKYCALNPDDTVELGCYQGLRLFHSGVYLL